MKKPGPDQRIMEIARDVGADDGDDTVGAIIESCRRKVKGWMQQAGGITSVPALEKLICRRLDLQFQEFGHQSELDAIVRQHVNAGDVVFASLPADFDDDTFATLIRCRPNTNASKYVAVIDCRGGKANRRWFSRWHEIAHLLTMNAPGELQPVHRSTSKHSPVERLMDLIAADIGFFEPLFAPVFSAVVHARGRLDFAAVNRVRQSYAPEASFQATTIACLKRWPKPAMHLEAGLGLTAAEERQFDEEPVPAKRPTPKLRVMKVIGNEASRQAGLRLVRNMQVPEESILHGFFFSREPVFQNGGMSVEENLGQWRHSNGRHLPSCRVAVEPRLGRRHIEALVQAL